MFSNEENSKCLFYHNIGFHCLFFFFSRPIQKQKFIRFSFKLWHLNGHYRASLSFLPWILTKIIIMKTIIMIVLTYRNILSSVLVFWTSFFLNLGFSIWVVRLSHVCLCVFLSRIIFSANTQPRSMKIGMCWKKSGHACSGTKK